LAAHMGRQASLHITLAALLLLLHVVGLPAAMPKALLVPRELIAVLLHTFTGCDCAGLQGTRDLEDAALLCCSWCLQLQAVSWCACSIWRLMIDTIWMYCQC
jgi:hypothetical protein